jgi:glycosyltransferase involved in cell wall biosynthesis
VDNPLVSVVMTAFNSARTIAPAIESVLASTYSNYELIIVDDASIDDTTNIAQDYTEQNVLVNLFVNEENIGDYPNRNRAATYAKGKYLKYLDSDDLMYPHCLEVMVNSMERFPKAGFGLASKVSSKQPFPVMLSPREAYLENFGRYGHFGRSPGSSIIKLEAFRRVGGFSGKRMIGDYELWLTLGRYYSMVKFPFDLYWSRVHENQESQSNYAQTNYPLLLELVLNEALNHPDCVLNRDEKRWVKKTQSRSKIKNFIRARLPKF